MKLAGGVALGVAAQLSSVGLLLAAAWLIVRAAEQPPVLHLMVAIVAVRFFGISRSVLRYAERLVTHDVAFSDAVEHRVAAYVELDRIAPAGVGELRRGDLVSRVVGDVTKLQDRLLRVRIPWWTGAAAAAVVVSVVGAIDLRSGLVLGVGTVACALGLRLTVAQVGAARRSGAQAQGRLAAEVTAAVVAGRELVALGAYERARDRATVATRDAQRAQLGGVRAAGVGAALVLAATGAAVSLLAAASGGVDPVLVGVVLLAPIALVESLDGWAEAERVRPEVVAAADRLSVLRSIPSPVADPPTAESLPTSFGLQADELVVGWDVPATSPVTLRVPPGGAVAVTGPSGSGKSTLAYTLLRMLPAHAGQVRLGGVPLDRLDASQVRQVIGYLGQDDLVFDTSVRENLRVAAPQADDQRLRAALTRAGLDLDLDRLVGEQGSRLSGGERQRLCLARLVLADHRILVLDEPTEHLDAPTAEALMDDVLALAATEGRSLVVITHSPAVLARFADDQIVRISPRSGGRVTDLYT